MARNMQQLLLAGREIASEREELDLTVSELEQIFNPYVNNKTPEAAFEAVASAYYAGLAAGKGGAENGNY